jgi:hypothetical protein
MVNRAALPLLLELMLAACQDGAAPSNNAMAAPKALPEGDVSAAERLVRQKLGNPADIVFSSPRRSASDGVRIVCGRYAQGGGPSQRYIVVDSRDAFVEPQMVPREMDRADAEFCQNAGAPPLG